MYGKKQFRNLRLNISARPLAVTVFVLTVILTQSAQAQTFTIIHQFSGGADGASPESGLTMDAVGNLYGTTQSGGSTNCPQAQGGLPGCGVVFQLSNLRSGWVFTPIHSFTGTLQGDGANPANAVLVVGPDGSLYGTTYGGGAVSPRLCIPGCGTVFKLTPISARGWVETVLYSFRGVSDGRHPGSDVVFDRAGNLYGTTLGGGVYNHGTVYELSPSRGGWTESVPYSFMGGYDGYDPSGGVTFDQIGDLYGVTFEGGGAGCGGYGCGTVYQLTPSESGWTENILYSFPGGGGTSLPGGDLIFDRLGNLYGITAVGTPFMLTPSGGGWNFTVLYDQDFEAGAAGQGLTMDAAGNLYGTTWVGGIGDCTDGCGTVFKLTPVSGGWTYTLLHNFAGLDDGARPVSTVLVDAHGNLYGTASARGTGPCSDGCGVVWEITP
jgi:uncharacterized repeat protein (TIGR03803 family)